MFQIGMGISMISILVSLLLGLAMMIIISSKYKKSIKGITNFTIAYSLALFGMLLLIFRDTLVPFISIVVGNTLILASKISMLHGTRAILNRPKKKYLFAILGLVSIVALCTEFFIFRSVNLRIVLISLISISTHLIAAMSVFRGRDLKRKPELLFYINIFFSLLYIVRIALLIVTQEVHQSFLDYSSDAIIIFFEGLLSLVYIIGLLSLINTKHQKEIKDSESLYRALFDNAGAGIGYYDLEGRVLLLNQIAIDYLGDDIRDHLGKKFQERYPEERAGKFLKRFELAKSSGSDQSFEDLMHEPQGQRWYQSIYKCITDENKELIGIQIISTDITELKESEEKLKNKDILYNAIVTNISEVISIVDTKPSITFVTPNCEKVFGWTREELIGTSGTGFIHEDDYGKVLEGFGSLLKQPKGTLSFECRQLCKNGRYKHIRLDAINLFEDPVINGILLTTTDITETKALDMEKKKADAIIRNQQKLDSIGTLASGVAHEINNPINGIMNYSQLILDSENSDSEINEYAGEIIHETDRVAQIVRNLLKFSRVDSGIMIKENLSNVIDDTLSLARTILKKDQIELKLNVDNKLPAVMCNSQQIQQVIMNLITNARDSLNEKYKEYNVNKIIQITLKEIINTEKRYARITVKDFGMGIPEENIDRVFEPFFTSKSRALGTGLGLSISYKIVEEHNGHLSFRTSTGKYTEFYIDLPLDE